MASELIKPFKLAESASGSAEGYFIPTWSLEQIWKMLQLFPLIWVSAFAGAFASQGEDEFVEGLIDTWHLHSPTVIGVWDGDLPEICRRLLCLTNGMDTDEVLEHLSNNHRSGK